MDHRIRAATHLLLASGLFTPGCQGNDGQDGLTFGSGGSSAGEDTDATTGATSDPGTTGEDPDGSTGSTGGGSTGGGTSGGSTGGGTTTGADPDQGFWMLEGVTAPDMTPDGSVVLTFHPNDGSAFRWDPVNGEQLATKSGPYPVPSISDDGLRLAGTMDDGTGKQIAAIWDDGGDWTPIGDLGDSCDFFRSTGYDMSGDGTVVVGLGWAGCSGVAFWWEEGVGMSALESLEQGNNRASVISRNGKVAAGFAQTFSRTPALWWDDGTTLVPDPGQVGEFLAITTDGTLAAGTAEGQGMYWTQEEGLVMLGNLEPLGAFEATYMLETCQDGNMLIGTEAAMFGSGTAIVWTPGDGLRRLEDLLDEEGIVLPPEVSHLERAESCSADGTRIAGTYIHTIKGPKAFVVDLPGLGPS